MKRYQFNEMVQALTAILDGANTDEKRENLVDNDSRLVVFLDGNRREPSIRVEVWTGVYIDQMRVNDKRENAFKLFPSAKFFQLPLVNSERNNGATAYGIVSHYDGLNINRKSFSDLFSMDAEAENLASIGKWTF